MRKSHLCMLALLTISVTAVGVSAVIGADSGATAEIPPETPEITLESTEAETELLEIGDTPVLGLHCQICPAPTGYCQNPQNLGKKCGANPFPGCKCSWCSGSLNCFEWF